MAFAAASYLGNRIGLPLHRDPEYRQTLNIKRTKSKHLNVSRFVSNLSLPNPLTPGVKSRMKR